MDSRFRCAWMLGVLVAILTTVLAAPADAATPAPGVVTGLVAKPSTSTVVLSWKPAKRATHYRVCLVTARESTRCYRSSDRTTKRTWTFTNLRPTSDTDYYFSVKSYRGNRSRISALRGFNLLPPPTPDRPAGITQDVTTSAVTITWAPSKHARTYSVCLAGTARTTRCTRASPRSGTRSATFSGLRPTAGGDFFYRIRAYNGTSVSQSAQQRIDLPVGTIPVVSPARGASGVIDASWPAAVNAETYQVEVATNWAMTRGLTTYTVTGTSASRAHFTIGVTYYVRVRALNGLSKGVFSRPHSIRLPSRPTHVTVMTYNLCGQDKCVTRANGIKTWSKRRSHAGKIVRRAGADIISTQESHDVDTQFGRELYGYRLAAYSHSKSLFYDKAKYYVRRSGSITLSRSQKKYAVWAEFLDTSSRGTFIVVDAHLQPFKSKRNDDLRSAQTTVLLREVTEINPTRLPVIYAGDFNSNRSNAQVSGGYDAPRKVFTAAGLVDAFGRARNRIHADYNSANQAVNPPLRFGDHVDHVYIDPTITVRSWRIVTAMSKTGHWYATPFASDHNPLRTVLTLRSR